MNKKKLATVEAQIDVFSTLKQPEQLVEILKKHPELNLNTSNKQGETLLTFCIKNKLVKSLIVLLSQIDNKERRFENKPDVTACDKAGQDPLTLAKSSPALLKLLTEKVPYFIRNFANQGLVRNLNDFCIRHSNFEGLYKSSQTSINTAMDYALTKYKQHKGTHLEDTSFEVLIKLLQFKATIPQKNIKSLQQILLPKPFKKEVLGPITELHPELQMKIVTTEETRLREGTLEDNFSVTSPSRYLNLLEFIANQRQQPKDVLLLGPGADRVPVGQKQKYGSYQYLELAAMLPESNFVVVDKQGAVLESLGDLETNKSVAEAVLLSLTNIFEKGSENIESFNLTSLRSLIDSSGHKFLLKLVENLSNPEQVQPSVEVKQLDAANIGTLEGCYDLIIATDVLHYVFTEKKDSAVEQLQIAMDVILKLKVGGVLVVDPTTARLFELCLKYCSIMMPGCLSNRQLDPIIGHYGPLKKLFMPAQPLVLFTKDKELPPEKIKELYYMLQEGLKKPS